MSKVDELLSLQKAAMTAEKERDDYKQLVGNLLSKITALEEQLKVRNKNLYGGKSQKGIHKKTRSVSKPYLSRTNQVQPRYLRGEINLFFILLRD